MSPRRIRPFFRIASLIFFTACGTASVAWGVGASPFVAANVLAARSLPPVTGWIGLIVLVACIARRRWFCRWACPVGFLLQQVQRLAKGRRRLMKARLGRWLALASVGGAALGLPLLLWLDPIVLFTAGFGVAYAPARIGAIAAIAILAGIIVASLLDRGFWCRCLCPAGGVQDVCAAWRYVVAVRGKKASKPARGRRVFLVASASAVVCGIGAILGHAARRLVRSRRLRPPGAVDEASFAGLCSRCGNCVRACPTRIIRPATQGEADCLTPIVTFADAYCREDCVRCTEVCPTGALQRLTLEEKPAARIGLARLDLDLCLLTYDEECDVCRRECPYEAISIAWNNETYTSAPVVDAAKCNGCGRCQMMCPGRPEGEPDSAARAIMVGPVEHTHKKRGADMPDSFVQVR